MLQKREQRDLHERRQGPRSPGAEARDGVVLEKPFRSNEATILRNDRNHAGALRLVSMPSDQFIFISMEASNKQFLRQTCNLLSPVTQLETVGEGELPILEEELGHHSPPPVRVGVVLVTGGVLGLGQLRHQDDPPLGEAGLQAREAGEGLTAELRLPLPGRSRESGEKR